MDDGDTMTDKPLTLERIAAIEARIRRPIEDGKSMVRIKVDEAEYLCAAARAALSKGE
jgi:hypothetical protein